MEIASNITIDEGVNHAGIRRQIHLEGDQIVTQQTYDAQPMLDAAKEARRLSAGDRWGDGHFIGVVPNAVLAQINDTYQGSEERKKQMVLWLKANPAFVTFDKFLK